MIIKVWTGFGYANAAWEEEFDLPDDMTEDEIDQEVWEWAIEHVETSWEKVGE